MLWRLKTVKTSGYACTCPALNISTRDLILLSVGVVAGMAEASGGAIT